MKTRFGKVYIYHGGAPHIKVLKPEERKAFINKLGYELNDSHLMGSRIDEACINNPGYDLTDDYMVGSDVDQAYISPIGKNDVLLITGKNHLKAWNHDCDVEFNSLAADKSIFKSQKADCVRKFLKKIKRLSPIYHFCEPEILNISLSREEHIRLAEALLKRAQTPAVELLQWVEQYRRHYLISEISDDLIPTIPWAIHKTASRITNALTLLSQKYTS